MKLPGLIPRLLLLAFLTFQSSVIGASDLVTLSDYDLAARNNDVSKLRYLRSYIMGAVDTHLLYSRMLKNWTSFNALCTGKRKLQVDELGAIFELEMLSLRRRYGEDIMGMPIVETIPGIVEKHYRCF